MYDRNKLLKNGGRQVKGVEKMNNAGKGEKGQE